MSLFDWFLWALVVIPIFSWLASGILVYKAIRKPYVVALVERAGVAVLGSIASTVIAFLVLNRFRHWVDLDPQLSVGLIVVALFLLEIPALIWFVLYLTVYRDRPDDERWSLHRQDRQDEQDREVGDKRRELQARDAEETPDA